MVSGLKFSLCNFTEKCNYLNENIICVHKSKEYTADLKVYCKKIIPFVYFYKQQIFSYNCTPHNISTNQISLILPNFPKAREGKRSIIMGFIGLAYEGIFSYLHNKRHHVYTHRHGSHKIFADKFYFLLLFLNMIVHYIYIYCNYTYSLHLRKYILSLYV